MAKPFVTVVELEDGKLMLISIVNERQLEAIRNVFEPRARSWRGQFQPLAKAIVDAYNVWKSKQL